MSLFKKKKKPEGNLTGVVTDRYVPVTLPTCGMRLENFVASDYSMNDPAVIEAGYHDMEARMDGVAATCDLHSAGSECDAYADAQLRHSAAVLDAEAAEHKDQLTRIRSAREMRKASLKRTSPRLQREADRLDAAIAPLEGLYPQFQIHIGRRDISVSLPITIVAMIVDSFVNYGFLQTIILSNDILLKLTVITMAIMSDGSMWALGTLLSRRNERFAPKPIYYAECVCLFLCFLLSVVASVMIRFGSMPATFGTVNAAGEYVGKASYSLAEYGVTLVTAFVTTATGILSFAFSLDVNAFAVTLRERWKKDRDLCLAGLEAQLAELALLDGAPDPGIRDEARRKAALRQIEATRVGLKLHCRLMMLLRMEDADFTEKMARSAEELLRGTPDKAPIPLFDRNDDLNQAG